MSWTFIILETHVSLADTEDVTTPVAFPFRIRLGYTVSRILEPHLLTKAPKEYESCLDADLHRTGHCCLLPAA